MPTLFKRSNCIYYVKSFDHGKVRWRSTRQKQKPLAAKVLLEFKNSLLRPIKVSLSVFE